MANGSNQLVLPRRDDSLSLKVIPLSVAQTCTCMLSHSGFSRQEYWSGLPFPPPGNLPDSGIKPTSPALQADFFVTELPGKPTLLYECLSSSVFRLPPGLCQPVLSTVIDLAHLYPLP